MKSTNIFPSFPKFSQHLPGDESSYGPQFADDGRPMAVFGRTNQVQGGLMGTRVSFL
jgi:hypothetical protein